MELVILANLPATRLALLKKLDWMWVSSQRAEGRNYSFIPYSSSVGGLMVNPNANIKIRILKVRKLVLLEEH